MDGGREYMGKLYTFPSICCELQIALKELSLLKKYNDKVYLLGLL